MLCHKVWHPYLWFFSLKTASEWPSSLPLRSMIARRPGLFCSLSALTDGQSKGRIGELWRGTEATDAEGVSETRFDIVSVQQHSTRHREGSTMRECALPELSSPHQGQESTHFPWPQRTLQCYGRHFGTGNVRCECCKHWRLSHVDTKNKTYKTCVHSIRW